MNPILTRLAGIASIAALTIAGGAVISHAQATAAPTFPVPLALIDRSGNVDVIPAGQSTPSPLTQDANFVLQGTTPATHDYGRPRWSPDGTRLAFTDSVTRNVFVSINGSAPRPIATNAAPGYPVAWLPDSSGVVYAVDTQAYTGSQTTYNLIQVAADGSSSKTIGALPVQVGCGGGGITPAMALEAVETGYANNAPSLVETRYGLLVTNSCRGDGLSMVNSGGQVAWTMAGLARAIVSPDGIHAVAVNLSASNGGGSGQLVTVDLGNGQVTPFAGAPAVDQAGWSADGQTILYSAISAGQVTLWKIPVNGTSATPILTTTAGAIPVITTTPDSQTVVFSYIDTTALATTIYALPITSAGANLGSASTVAAGGQPHFPLAAPIGSSTPVALPTAPIATYAPCVVNTNWQYTYIVHYGDSLSAIAQRAGTTTNALAAANCLYNPNAIYTGELLHVPNPVAAPPTPLPTSVPGSGVRRISFLPGEISGAITGQTGPNMIDHLVIHLGAGQTLSLRTIFTSGNAILIVYGADGTVLQSQGAGSPSFNGIVPNTEDYYIDVLDVSGSGTAYSLSVSTSPLVQPTVPPPPGKGGGLQRISFGPGAISAAVGGTLAAQDVNHWVINVQGGQTLSVALSVSSAQAIVIVYGADGTVLQTDHVGSASFSGVVPSTQDYYIDVRSIIGTPQAYTMTVNIPPGK